MFICIYTAVISKSHTCAVSWAAAALGLRVITLTPSIRHAAS